MVQRIERRFPMPEICVRFALGPQKRPRGVMESTKHYGCFGGGSNPPGGTKNMHVWSSGRRHQTANLILYTAGSNPATCSKIMNIDMESGAKR